MKKAALTTLLCCSCFSEGDDLPKGTDGSTGPWGSSTSATGSTTGTNSSTSGSSGQSTSGSSGQSTSESSSGGSTGSGSSSGSGSSAGSSTGNGSSTGGGTVPLFFPCSEDTDCENGVCLKYNITDGMGMPIKQLTQCVLPCDPEELFPCADGQPPEAPWVSSCSSTSAAAGKYCLIAACGSCPMYFLCTDNPTNCWPDP